MEAATLAQLGPAEPTLLESDETIPMRDGFHSTVKIHKPAASSATGSPLIVLIFGGGFISGSKDQLTGYARAMVRLFGAVVVNISYRLAPEHKFPKGQEDCWDSVQWLAAHAEELGADPTLGFIVGGVSAGGTSSLVVTQLAVEHKLSPPITGQWLSVPAIMDAQHVPQKYRKLFLSREQNASAPIVSADALAAFKHHTAWGDSSPLRFPVLSPTPLKDLPPTYIQADGMDPLRDDALIYEEMLKEAGVKTKIDLYAGCPHGHFSFMPGIEVSERAEGDIMVGVGWLLGSEVTREQGMGAMVASSS